MKLLISNDVLNEYAEIIEQRTNAVVADNVVKFLLESPDVEAVEIYFKWSVIEQDADDNKFVDCALNGQATLLVTDDRHFNILNEIGFPPVQVMRTVEFLAIVETLA